MTHASRANNESKAASLEDIPSHILSHYIMPLVGRGYYVFVSLACTKWKDAYSSGSYARFALTASNFGNDEQERLCKAAARLGSINVLTVAEEHGIKLCFELYVIAASQGKVSDIEFLYQGDRFNRRCPLNDCKKLLEVAIRHGQIDVLEWLHTHDEIQIGTVGDGARVWLIDVEGRDECDVLNYATEMDQFEVVCWLLEKCCQMFASFSRFATIGGNLDIVQFGLTMGCRWEPNLGKSCRKARTPPKSWSGFIATLYQNRRIRTHVTLTSTPSKMNTYSVLSGSWTLVSHFLRT